MKYLLTLLLFASLEAKPFIIGELHDRLGNQLFEVAATLSLAFDNDAEAIFPDLRTRQDEGIPLNRSQVFYRLNDSPPPKKATFRYREDPSFHYSPIVYKPNMSLRGYFQSEKYFKHNREKILPLFDPKPEVMAYLKKKYPILTAHPYTVAIHLRDYEKELGPTNKVFWPVGRPYVERAVALFPEEAIFLVFSDRIDWAKWVLKGFPRRCIFIEGNTYIQDFYFMSLCKHQIISNSSFSWWAAYLNKNPDKVVVAPRRWFHPDYPVTSEHIIPPEWIIR